MKTVTSISGGKTSAYLAANYPSDHLIFSLVRTEDPKLKFKDKYLRKMVEDKLQTDFVGTLEQDTIIHTMFDLEQYLGKEITWVTGVTFDELLSKKAGRLPSKLRRYCTTELKIIPIFLHCYQNIAKIVEMPIGYRATEANRAKRIYKQLDENGVQSIKYHFDVWEEGTRYAGKQKWEMFPWRVPKFPLIEDNIYKDDIQSFWEDKPVRFAVKNNCTGCFHQKPQQLKAQYNLNPEKFEWWIRQEQNRKKGTWKEYVSYDKIKDMDFNNLFADDIFGCDSGFCGM